MAYTIGTVPLMPSTPREYVLGDLLVAPSGGGATPPPTEGQIWPRGEKATG